MNNTEKLTPSRARAIVAEHGGLQAAARAEGLTYGKVQRAYNRAVALGIARRLPIGRKAREDGDQTVPVVDGRLTPLEHDTRPLPKDGEVAYYIITCAQNNTELNLPVWDNLMALAEHYGAEVMVSRFTYNKSAYRGQAEKDQQSLDDYRGFWWDKKITPFLVDHRVKIAPGLVFCGEMNTLPTAVRPLSGLETLTGRRSGIFPHPKIAMDSIPSMQGEPTKFNYTTGAVTLRNYIQRKAGFKAEFHHCYGALLVEVDSDGHWWCRQLNASDDGTIYDLDLVVLNGNEVATHSGVAAITWGDIHVAEIDETVKELAWGQGGMLDQLMPRYQFVHDVLDFKARSHHDAKDPHKVFLRYSTGEENVREEVENVGVFLDEVVPRDWCKTFVVSSNHHEHMRRWLKEQNALRDPVNARFWLDLQSDVYAYISAEKKEPNLLKLALSKMIDFHSAGKLQFLDEDESFIICGGHLGEGIECGMHGDLGTNGSRGSRMGLAKLARRANIGHSHSAGIWDGVYQTGTSATLTPDWVRGPSSWSHSHIVTYPNGKRAIITMFADKWRA